MPIAELIKGHETVVLTGFFTLLGVFITLLVNSIQKFLENRHALKLKRLELAIDIKKNHLLEPVIDLEKLNVIVSKKTENLNRKIDVFYYSLEFLTNSIVVKLSYDRY